MAVQLVLVLHFIKIENVNYGSRALPSVEQRYSQTELETLACVWSIEHFYLTSIVLDSR